MPDTKFKIELSAQEIDALCEALTCCIDEGDFEECEMLQQFRELLPRLEAYLK